MPWRCAVIAWGLALLVACASPSSTVTGARRTCAGDLDCASGAYCTPAGVCRTDCFKDSDCLGPATSSQCNAQGRCIDGVVPQDGAAPEAGDAGSADAGAGG